jgi:hypothetical protein
MINLNEEDWFLYGVKAAKTSEGKTAKQLALVVDQELASFIGVAPEIADKFLNANSFVECQQLEPEIFCVVMTGPNISETVFCNEKIYSILLSNPKILFVDINKYKYAEKLEPGWAYINEDFIIPGVYE